MKPTVFEEFLRSAGSQLSNTGVGAKMAKALEDRDPARVTDYMQQGFQPNNAFGRISYIHSAMAHHLLDLSTVTDDETCQRSRLMCFALLNAGARLEHRPCDAGPNPTALSNPLVWADAEFGRDILIAASATALARHEAVPRLSLSDIFTPLGSASGAGAASVLKHAFSMVMAVQKAVGERLDAPQTEAEKQLAAQLPPADRAFWREAAAVAAPPRILSF